MTICDVNKIDSNATGLSFAEEACPRILPSVAAGDPSDPVWRGLEPNSYADFGGSLNTIARQPISASRQRKKGTVTGFDASGGFNIDLTQNNLTRLLQGFFFADAAEKPNTDPMNSIGKILLTSVSTTDDSFNSGAGLNAFIPGHIIYASNFARGNNGRHRVLSSIDTKVTVENNLTDETPEANAKLEVVGFRFAAGEVTLTANAASAVLSLIGSAKATSTLTVTVNPAANETVTVAGRIYTFKVAPVAANEVLIGANLAASLTNLAAAVNRTGTPGTQYGKDTVLHPLVVAVATATTVVFTAKSGGIEGNTFASTESLVNGSFGAATFAGGTGSIGFIGLGLQVGEWIFVGGDIVASQFTTVASTNRPGYARIASLTDTTLTFDDTTWAPQTDNGATKTIEIFFGTVLKNGTKLHSYQLERTLGEDGNGTQSQYLEGAIANELTFNLPQEDKLNVDLTFIALDDTTRTGTEGLKAGARIAAAGEDAFNSSLDIYRIRMAIVDPAQINNQALFAFVTEATLTIGNNASPIKVLGRRAAVDVSVGNFDAGGSVTALFSTVEAIRAIRRNSDLNFNVIAAHDNAGFVFDMPLLGVGGGQLNVELNSPVTIPLDSSGAQNPNGYTLLSNWFTYLPAVAMPV
jgi:hypothetical protein